MQVFARSNAFFLSASMQFSVQRDLPSVIRLKWQLDASIGEVIVLLTDV